jgi:hypothetical protein
LLMKVDLRSNEGQLTIKGTRPQCRNGLTTLK